MQYNITPHKDFLDVQITGDFSHLDLYELYNANLKTNLNRLADLTGADVDVNLVEYEAFLSSIVNKRHNERPSYKVAVLFGENVAHTFATVVQMAQQSALENPIRVFFDRTEAEAWLKPKKKWYQFGS